MDCALRTRSSILSTVFIVFRIVPDGMRRLYVFLKDVEGEWTPLKIGEPGQEDVPHCSYAL